MTISPRHFIVYFIKDMRNKNIVCPHRHAPHKAKPTRRPIFNYPSANRHLWDMLEQIHQTAKPEPSFSNMFTDHGRFIERHGFQLTNMESVEWRVQDNET